MDEGISDQDDSGKCESLEIFVLGEGIQGRKGGIWRGWRGKKTECVPGTLGIF